MRIHCCTFLLSMILVGCCSPKGLLHVIDPGHEGHYRFISPVRLDPYLALIGERFAAVNSITVRLEQKLGDAKDAQDLIREIRAEAIKERAMLRDLFDEFEKLASEGGIICQYEWADGDTVESGLLVLKGRKVLKRSPWTIDFKQTE